jgi:transcriptional regulator
MYLPSHFREERGEVLQALMRRHPLAVLVTMGTDGLLANHIPLEWDPEPAPHGSLVGHVARGNPMWRDRRPEIEALAIFQGPQSYVSPSWYETKRETGKVVPTWNYAVAQARGPLVVHDDTKWVRALVGRLTDRHESGFPVPWKVTDAPEEFIDRQLKAIVGIEIPIRQIEGKWKMSQNRPEADRRGVIEGLRELGDTSSEEAAALVAARLAETQG